MTVFINEKEIDFCVDAIKLIKDSNATFIKKDTRIINDKCIELYKNGDNEIVIKINENDYIKEENPRHCYGEMPYKGSPLEKKRQLEQAKELLKRWIDTKYDREELLRLTEKFLNIE